MHAALLTVLIMLAGPTLAAERVVQVYAWAEYFGPETLKKFEAETGIKVQYDTFDSADVLETKMLTGGSGYDVVVPSIAILDRLIQAKALQPTEMKRMPNVADLDPQLLAQLAKVDPGNFFAVPYTWGTTGLAFNRQEVEKRISNPPLSSLDLLFKPEYASSLKDCGISLIDAPQEVISIALNYLGRPPFSKNPDDLHAAQELLATLRPSVRYFSTGTQSADLSNGNLCLALTYSGDAVLARSQAVAANKLFSIEYSVPKEGTLTWIDTLAIPVDAPHPQEAKAFIEFITRPEAMSELTSSFFYANANLAAIPLLATSITADPAIYPPEDVRRTLFGEQPVPLRTLRERTRAWANFRNQH
ncbi:polyamine ABC transporter substrate-binding protein [Pseudomonas sp. HMWF032]|uniref:polyamine ABC transporter substrate-binding protein n=1 Tax=Pseudomonas sp. HMWF032 TaxID=2056866 RepID=UPI0035326D0F